MIEVEYGGRGHRTRLRNDLKDQLVCLEVPPASVYKGAKGEGCGQPYGGAGGVLLLPGVGLPPILVGIGFPEGEERERGRPPLLVLIGLGEGGGARPTLGCPFHLSTKAQ